MVGYTMICFGVTASLCSYVSGILCKYTGRVPQIVTAAALNLAALVFMTQWKPTTGTLIQYFCVIAIWGVSDGIWNCQVNSNQIFKAEAADLLLLQPNDMLHLMRLPWSNMAGQFRSFQWDPVLIIAQIVSMVSLWYFSLGMWIFILDVIGKFDLSTEQIFTQSDLGLYEDSGRTNIIAYALNSLTVPFVMWGVVGRTKQCLDFTATIHLFHFFACWISFGYVPVTFWWWVTNIICVALTTVMAEYLCMQSEMNAIPVAMGPKVDL